MVIVEGVCRETGVDEGRSRRSTDLREIGTAGALAAFDEVASDADIVGRGGPVDGDGERGGGIGSKIGGRGGRSGVAPTSATDCHRVAGCIGRAGRIIDEEIGRLTAREFAKIGGKGDGAGVPCARDLRFDDGGVIDVGVVGEDDAGERVI